MHFQSESAAKKAKTAAQARSSGLPQPLAVQRHHHCDPAQSMHRLHHPTARAQVRLDSPSRQTLSTKGSGDSTQTTQTRPGHFQSQGLQIEGLHFDNTCTLPGLCHAKPTAQVLSGSSSGTALPTPIRVLYTTE